MPRRKRTRRERRERQEERREAEAAGVPVAEAPEAAPRREAAGDVSFSGAGGGLLGAGTFFALAVGVLIDPGDVSRLWAIPVVFIGLCFLPAVWVSVVRGHPRRRRVLRITTIGSMALAMLSFVLGAGFALAVLLAPPTALLAFGAGFIFQRSSAGD